MAISISHLFVSAIPDDPAAVLAGEVVPSNWNAAHALSGGTSGSVLFIDGGGNFAQDNANLFWNASLKDLHIGGAYYVGASRALYLVPNVTENNWFEGNAGNQTVTGYGNFGTGDNALSSVTTGFDNTAVGTNALKDLTTGSSNFGFGHKALQSVVTGSSNVAIGPTALNTLEFAGSAGGSNNVALGLAAMASVGAANNNIAIGTGSLQNVTGSTTATLNVIIGNDAGGQLGVTAAGGSVQFNTMIGPNAGKNLNGNAGGNTWIGGYAGPSAAPTDTISISPGSTTYALFDWHLTTLFKWTMSYAPLLGIPPGLHIYNYQDALLSTTNYERAILDWGPTTNVFRIANEAGGTGVKRLIAIDGFAKAGAPAAGDLPAGSFALIDDTSANQTWLVFNKAGVIRKVQLT